MIPAKAQALYSADFETIEDQRPDAKRRVAKRLFIAAAIGSMLGLATANPLLTGAGLWVIPLVYLLLWRNGEPPVLLFVAGFQWLQVYVPVLVANYYGEPIGARELVPEFETAAWLGFLVIIVLAIGMRHGRGSRPTAIQDPLSYTRLMSPRRLLIAYAIAFAAALGAIAVGQAVPGLRQLLLPAALLRWAVLFILLWCAVQEPRFRTFALTLLALEIIIGFSGFFSSFKTIIFLAIVVLLAHPDRRPKLLRPNLVAAFAVAMVLASYWEAVKLDYRAFISQGTGSQAVLVSHGERIRFLVDRAREVGLEDLYDGFGQGVARLGYLEFFARSIETVPALIPHQGGRLWAEAIEHVFTPRLFFPDKESVSDSERTNEFSGIRVAGEEQGTSIAIGYAGESYIDYGPAFMFVPIYLLGALWGFAFRWLVGLAHNALLGTAIATTFILNNALLFESSNIKLVGGAISSLIFFWALLRFGRRWIWSSLCGR